MNDEAFKNRMDEIKKEYVDQVYEEEDYETAETVEAYLCDFADEVFELYRGGAYE